MTNLTRRQFTQVAVATACACAACPSRLLAAGSAPVAVGPVKDFAADGIWDKWADRGFLIVRKGAKIYAVSSQCTHRSGQLVAGSSGIKCTKHNGVYNVEGEPISGPPTIALSRYAISVHDGQVVVDTSKSYGRGEWSEAGSFIQAA